MRLCICGVAILQIYMLANIHLCGCVRVCVAQVKHYVCLIMQRFRLFLSFFFLRFFVVVVGFFVLFLIFCYL